MNKLNEDIILEIADFMNELGRKQIIKHIEYSDLIKNLSTKQKQDLMLNELELLVNKIIKLIHNKNFNDKLDEQIK